MNKEIKTDYSILDQKSDYSNSYNDDNMGHIPSGNAPELSNLDMLDTAIDLDLIYDHYHATKDWQKQNINIAIGKYKNLFVKYLLERSQYTKGTKFFQFPHKLFDLKVGKPTIYGTSPVRRESLVQVIMQLCPLYTIKEKGNSLKQKVSLMELNFDFINLIRTQSTEDLLIKLYGDIDISDPKLVDLTPINIKSLESYIKANEALTKRNETIQRYHDEANMILTVAKATNKVFPQIINESSYGRRYYKGKNLQQCSSVVRKAALGDHYEYDLNAAVYSIKLNLCSFFSETKFTYTSEYLEYKDAIRKRLAKLVFEDTDKFHLDIIKQAINAIGFGARKNGNGYFDENGTWKQTSLQDIFSYKSKTTGKLILAKSKFDSFINDKWVENFINEQQQMTSLITDYYKTNEIVTKETHKFLVDGRNSINQNRLMAFVFQSIERIIMDSACEFINSTGAKVLLRVHDAVYTDKKINLQELHHKIFTEFQSDNLTWAGSKIISFTEVQSQGFYFESDDESDLPIEWRSVKQNTQPQVVKEVVDGQYLDSCNFNQLEYDEDGEIIYY